MLENVFSSKRRSFLLLLFLFLVVLGEVAYAQVDQGSIAITVVDPTGSVVPNASVKVNDQETGFTLEGTTTQQGEFVFSPLKIGTYSVTVTAPGFSTLTQTGLNLHVNERLAARLELRVGQQTENVNVSSSESPLLQTEQSSTAQVLTSQVINDTPLNGRNYVFIAQLTAGVDQSNGSRGLGGGDFSANGQRPEQNNFILDGVDNNTSAVDFLNGASFVVKPPPDALAEFKVQTSTYDAEFGHSAGAVVNASIKSGTNQLHGNLWEYLRNDALDATSLFTTGNAEYRQNQFGATIGGPIVRNKLFFFGDSEANRVVYGAPNGPFGSPMSVPTQLMRQGNFTELLNPSLTGATAPIVLYQPGSGGATPLSCNGQQNVFCPGQMDELAQKLLNLFPAPNANDGKTYDNFTTIRHVLDNTVQWDGRLDWNISSKDQAFVRVSYSNERGENPSPLGPILDGGFYADTGSLINKGENFAFSETHSFTPTLVNEFRLGFNAGHYAYLQENANTNISATLGLGGVPYGPQQGGLPYFSIGGLSGFGTVFNYPSDEHENVPQLLDNVTKVWGKHSIRTGFSISKIRSSVFSPQWGRGDLSYTGQFTGQPGAANTGYGVADFLANLQTSATVSNPSNADDRRWYWGAYVQDDYKLTPKLTVNVGLRFDYFQPYNEKLSRMANFVMNSYGIGTGTGQYLLPSGAKQYSVAPAFISPATADNIAIVYSGNNSLSDAQKTNFAPRVGFAFSPNAKVVWRAGYGIFYGGLENEGGSPNLSSNYPFNFNNNFYSASCNTIGQTCTADGYTLEQGFLPLFGGSLNNFVNTVVSPPLDSRDFNIRTPYSQQYNLSMQYALTNSMTGTIGYVGTTGRHLVVQASSNTPLALAAPGTNTVPLQPFPDFSSGYWLTYRGKSSYNSLQVKLEKQFTKGLYLLSSYTWSHSLDDGTNPLGDGNQGGIQNILLIPLSDEYTNSNFDIRHRFTFLGTYQLPFGVGRQYVNKSGLLNEVVGGWAITPVFTVQTGNPFSVSPDIPTAAGASAYAFLTGNPYAGGGSPPASNPGVTCPAKVHTLEHWFNPCAFSNPLPGNEIAPGQLITTAEQAIQYVGARGNQIYGPGYNRANVSLFKNFSTFETQYLQFRADIFNVYNHAAWGTPNSSINTGGGYISSTRTTGKYQPDARFIQLALKYYF